MKVQPFKLYCDLENSEFTLARGGENWGRQFPDLPEALAYAAEVATESTPLDVYNAQGKIIIQSTVEPVFQWNGHAVLGGV